MCIGRDTPRTRATHVANGGVHQACWLFQALVSHQSCGGVAASDSHEIPLADARSLKTPVACADARLTLQSARFRFGRTAIDGFFKRSWNLIKSLLRPAFTRLLSVGEGIDNRSARRRC